MVRLMFRSNFTSKKLTITKVMITLFMVKQSHGEVKCKQTEKHI